MDKKCSKYEGLFIFSDDETLQEHLLECEECRKEQEKMDRVSELIQEVKPYYLAKTKKKIVLKAMCASILFLFTILSFGVIENYEDMKDTLQYGTVLSAEDLGFPVDSYGLITVDE